MIFFHFKKRTLIDHKTLINNKIASSIWASILVLLFFTQALGAKTIKDNWTKAISLEQEGKDLEAKRALAQLWNQSHYSVSISLFEELFTSEPQALPRLSEVSSFGEQNFLKLYKKEFSGILMAVIFVIVICFLLTRSRRRGGSLIFLASFLVLFGGAFCTYIWAQNLVPVELRVVSASILRQNPDDLSQALYEFKDSAPVLVLGQSRNWSYVGVFLEGKWSRGWVNHQYMGL